MPTPLSTLFSDIFTDKKHEALLNGLVKHFNWSCVEVFENAETYSSAIEAFRLFYGNNLSGLQGENLSDRAGDLFVELQAAEEAHRESERLRLKEIADKLAASWSSKASVDSNVHDAVEENATVISQDYQASSEQVDENDAVLQEQISLPLNSPMASPLSSEAAYDQVTVSQTDHFPEEEALSPEEQGKREFVLKLLNDAKQVTANTSGKSRDDLDQLFSILGEKYYPLEEDESLRKAFRANLVKYAAEGLTSGLEKRNITLSQYLASAELNVKDTAHIVMYCRFFRAVIKQHPSNVLSLGDYKAIISPLLALLNEKTEALVTQQVSLFASLDLGKTLEVIHDAVKKSQKGQKGQSELMSRLFATVTIKNLPSFQLLTQLHPDAEQLFADPKFAPAMQMIATLAMADKDDIHTPLLLLLKVCVHEKETVLADKVLRLFMALKKPSQENYDQVQFLFSQDNSRQETLKNLSNLPLDEFAEYQTVLWEAAKTDKQRKIISDGWLEKLAGYRDQLLLSDELLVQREVLDGEKTEGQPFVSLFDEVIKNTQKVAIPSLTDLQKANSLLVCFLTGVEEEKANIAGEYAKSEKNHQSDLDVLVENQTLFLAEIDKKLTQLHESRQQAIVKKSAAFATLEDIKSNLGKSGFSNVEGVCQAHLDAVAQQFALMEEVTNTQLQQLELTKKNQALAPQELAALRNDNEQLLPQKMRALRAKQQSFKQAKQATNQLTAEIQTQVDTAQKALFEQATLFKNAFGQVVTLLNQQCMEAGEQQTQRQKQISEKKYRQEQIRLELRECDESKVSVEQNIKLAANELTAKTRELGKLSKEKLEPVSEQIQKLSLTPRFRSSIESFIHLFKEAIENRRSARYSAWALFKRGLAQWITNFPILPNSWIVWANQEINSSAIERSSPLKVKFAVFVASYQEIDKPDNWLIAWGKEVMNEHNHALQNEILEFENQVRRLEQILQKIPSQSSTADEENKTFASEIRGAVSDLLSKGLKIKDDQRASFFWRWSTNRSLDKFLEENKQLETSCKSLSEIQAGTDALIAAKLLIEQRIATLRQEIPSFDQKSAKLQKESDDLTSALSVLEVKEKADVVRSHTLDKEYVQLLPLYETVLSLVSSPIIDILYDTGLTDDAKLSQLKTQITKDKSSLLRDGMGDGIFANVVYHAVRHGTVEMLIYILGALQEKDRLAYLATPIIEQEVAIIPLALAVKRNDQAKINCLIQQGRANPNQQILDSKGNATTLLLSAYQQGQSKAVDSLLVNGADCQAKDSEGNTLLHYAAAKGDADMILRLIDPVKTTLDVSIIAAKNQAGDDALALLMKSNLSAEKKSELMPMLFKYLSEPTRLSGEYFIQLDQTGNNFLHHAASKGDLSLVKWLLAQPNKDLLNAKSHQGETALSLAVQAGRLEVVQFLLRQSVSLDGVKDVFLTALKQVATSADMMDVFLTHHQVSFFSDIKTLGDDPEHVLRKWTQHDQLQIKGSSYCYLTACANFENMKLLVAHGADPHAADELGNTVLHHAVLNGDLQKVEYLIEECRVEPHPQNKAGMTPLMALYEAGKLPEGTHRQVVDYLIQKASGIGHVLPGQARQTLTQRDKEANTLLHYAAKVADIDAVKQLIAQKPYLGVNPLDQQNKAGETAVHLLVKNEASLEESKVNIILGFLHSKGQANLHLADKSGKTPLDYATSFSVITFLINKLPEPLQDVRLTPIAMKIMASEGMTIEEKQKFIQGIATANKMNFALASAFYGNVSYIYSHSKQNSSAMGLTSGGLSTNGFSKSDYVRSFNSKSEDERTAEFRLMVVGQKFEEVAAILDSQSPPPFPKNLNQESNAYLSVADNTTLNSERRNFWVRVVEYREKKELTLQDYATGNTLLHALVSANDKGNLFTLNQTGILYVTERDHKNRTVLMLVREKFSQEIKGQPSYTHFYTKDQSVYLSVLQSIERRLVIEQNSEVVKKIVAELDFSQLTELEMLVSLFGQVRSMELSPQKTAFLWQLTDRNGKSLAESALSTFNGLASGLSVAEKKLPPKELAEKNPTFARSERILVNLLRASQVQQQGQSALGNKLALCRQEMAGQINYFAGQSKYNFSLSESAIQLRVLNFGKTFSTETSENVLLERYKALCGKSVQLHKATGLGSSQANNSSLLSTVFAPAPKEKPLTSEQLQKHYAHNMVVYLGLFIEASEIDTLVTLPSGSSEPCASLLAVAREKQLPSLYVEIVGRVLAQLGLANPIAMVDQEQAEAAYKQAVVRQHNVDRLNGNGAMSSVPAIPVAQGLRITAAPTGF